MNTNLPSESPQYATFLEAMAGVGAIHESSLVGGGVPDTGKLMLEKPYNPARFGYDYDYPPGYYHSDHYYHTDARLLHDLNVHFSERNLKNFEYVAHGQHAIIFSAEQDQKVKTDPKRIILRIHLGETLLRDCRDVFRSKSRQTFQRPDTNDKISYEEIDYLQVPDQGAISPKMLLGLGISCLENGYLFNDAHAGNVAFRLGDTRIGVLESHAVTDIRELTQTEKDERFTGFLRGINEIRRNYNQHRNRVLREAAGLKADWDAKNFGSRDVIHTLSHIVVLLDGNYFDSNLSNEIKTHPLKTKRQQAVQEILKQIEITDYKTMGPNDEFIVIPQPNPYPPDQKLLNKSAALAQVLRDKMKEIDVRPEITETHVQQRT